MQIKSNYYKKISSLFFVFLLASIFIFSSFAKAISTSAQISFKTADVIMVNDTAYPFVGWYSGNEIKTDTNDKVYRAYQKDTSCKDFIAVQKNTAEVRLINANKSNTSTNKSCSYSSWSESEKLSNIKDLSNRYIIYYWQDKNTIVRLSSGFNGTQIGSVSYSRENDSSKFIENTSGNCKDEININSSTDGSYIARSQTSEDQIISWNSDGREVKEKADKQVAGCYETKSVGVKLGYSENSDKKPEDATQVPGTVDTGSGPGDDAAQESNCSQALSPFGWVLCPATNFADNLYSFFKNLVNNLLFFESDKYQDNGLYDSWKVMVTLANAVLVLVAIVMIAAQIFNFEFISAYTVKKALPRIVIAAILIQLSWFMVTAGIQIVNAIGSGIYWLLVAPFVSQLGGVGNNDGILEIGPILAQGYSGTNVGNTVANAVVFHYVLAATVGLAAGLAYSGLWISVVIAAIGVVISLLVAIVTLVIREVLLIVLIAIAPIAIAFWILPGTNNLWNMWWKTFSKLLLMYPLIMLLFAGGTIAAILLASAGGGINILFAVIAFFAPMFMIGATYKFAGGAFASIANMVNKVGSSARGGVDKGFNPLRERIKANKQAVKDYQKTEAFKDLNEGVGGIRGMRAKWRTGTLGYGVRKDTIEAYKKRAEKARLQGLIASREDEGLQTKYLDTEADNLKSLWSAGSSVFEEDVKFNGKTFDKGTTIELNDKDQMAALAVTGDLAQRRAALKQLNALQADAQMRAVTTEYVTNGQSMPDGAVEQFSKIQSTEFFPAYKANAPDLAKGGAEAGFKEFRSQEMRTWSADTIKQATEHIQRLRMSSEASDNARALVLQNQFDAAIHEIANDPSNPAGSLSPEARIATRVAYDTGVISGSAKDRFNPDGTFNTNPKEKGYQP